MIRLERVEERLLFALGVQAPLDAKFLNRIGEAKAGRNDTDRAEDLVFIDEDFVRRAGQPIAA